MTTVITIANQKGGVGKTTTAVTLAHGLALKGKETLVIDLDPQGNAAKMLGLEKDQCAGDMVSTGKISPDMLRKARENLYIIPGNEETVYAQIMMAVKQKGRDYLAQVIRPIKRPGLKYIVFDTSPSVGGLQERAIFAADLVIVPACTDYMSADAISDTAQTIQQGIGDGWNGGVAILPTFYDERTNHARQIVSFLETNYEGQVISPIHEAVSLKDAAGEGKTIWEYDGHSRAAQEYARLLYYVMSAK
jgi:chromosome partitioning protein